MTQIFVTTAGVRHIKNFLPSGRSALAFLRHAVRQGVWPRHQRSAANTSHNNQTYLLAIRADVDTHPSPAAGINHRSWLARCLIDIPFWFVFVRGGLCVTELGRFKLKHACCQAAWRDVSNPGGGSKFISIV